MKTLKIGIAGYDRMKARTLAIARGEHKPGKGEPKVWFTSVESFAKVLSQRNRELLALVAREQPTSLTELAELSGRKKSNLSQYGFVELKEGRRGALAPRVPYDQVSLDVSLLMGDVLAISKTLFQDHGTAEKGPRSLTCHFALFRNRPQPAPFPQK